LANLWQSLLLLQLNTAPEEKPTITPPSCLDDGSIAVISPLFCATKSLSIASLSDEVVWSDFSLSCANDAEQKTKRLIKMKERIIAISQILSSEQHYCTNHWFWQDG